MEHTGYLLLIFPFPKSNHFQAKTHIQNTTFFRSFLTKNNLSLHACNISFNLKAPQDFLYIDTLHKTVKVTLSPYLKIVPKKCMKKNQLDSNWVLRISWSILNIFAWDNIKQTLLSFFSHTSNRIALAILSFLSLVHLFSPHQWDRWKNFSDSNLTKKL